MSKIEHSKPISASRWVSLLVAAIVFLALTFVFFVLTKTGQTLENTALRGADQVLSGDLSAANVGLNEITIWSLGLGTLAIGLIGVLRKQFFLAFIAMGVIVGGQVVTQSLKRFILIRPELVEVVGDFKGNSFPSGHTTIAMTLLIAVFLVVPYRFRGIAMFLVIGWSSGIGVYTLTAKWHRLSDTIGADMVALGLGAAASLLLLRYGKLRRVEGPPKRLRVILVVAITLVAAITFAIGLMIAAFSYSMPMHDSITEWNIYLAATSFSAAVSTFTGLIFWASWRRIDVTPKLAS